MLSAALCATIVLAVLVLPQVFGAPDGAPAHKPSGGMWTMYFRDPVLASFSFTRGSSGRVHRHGDVMSGSADIDADWLHPGEFTIAFKGKDLGRIADLGDRKIYDQGIGLKPGTIDVRGKSYSIFHTLVLKDKNFQHKAAPFTDRVKILIGDTGGIFLPGGHAARAPIKAGHVYLIRITDDKGKEKRLVKLRVLEYAASDHVTFLWRKLR